MAIPNYTLELFTDDDGGAPVGRWLCEDLEPTQAAALGLAMNHILQRLGTDVVKTRFGKALGGGLYEFRLDDTLDELLERLALKKKQKLAKARPGRMLFRVFFHPYGDKVLLLLGGYDKGRADRKREQEVQIQLARARLRRWQGRQRRASKRTTRPTRA